MGYPLRSQNDMRNTYVLAVTAIIALAVGGASVANALGVPISTPALQETQNKVLELVKQDEVSTTTSTPAVTNLEETLEAVEVEKVVSAANPDEASFAAAKLAWRMQYPNCYENPPTPDAPTTTSRHYVTHECVEAKVIPGYDGTVMVQSGNWKPL